MMNNRTPSLEIDLARKELHHLFTQERLLLSPHINFIYGRNGTGKSSLAESIKNQLDDPRRVFLFQGFESVIGKNEKLNAIILGEANVEINRSLEEKHNQLNQIEANIDNEKNELEVLDGKTEHFGNRLEAAKKDYNRALNVFKEKQSDIARKIKNNKPQIANPSYTRDTLKAEIEQSAKLDESTRKEALENLTVKEKKANKINDFDCDLNNLLDGVNYILTNSVKRAITLKRLEGNPKKEEFAQTGIQLHKAGDICAFCGNKVTEESLDELSQYFAGKDIENFQNTIEQKYKDVNSYIDNLEKIKINIDDFYPKYSKEGLLLEKELIEGKKSISKFLMILKSALDEKKKNLFTPSKSLSIECPNSLTDLVRKINKLTVTNNAMSVDKIIDDAQNRLRLDKVYQYTHEEAYLSIKSELDDKENKLEKIKCDEKQIKIKINRLDESKKIIEKEIQDLQKQTQNEMVLANRINELLAGKAPFELSLIKENPNLKGYYIVKNRDDKEVRDIMSLSSGELNFIAFLYFWGKIKENESVRNKVIIFDDPMNSNDEYFQYYIMSKLNEEMKKDRESIFILLTHNKHFYLNASYRYEYLKQSKLKNIGAKGAWHIHFFPTGKHTEIHYIESKEDDFKTSYESLWKDLKFLYNCNEASCDLLLNPARRILETFIKFNGLDSHELYAENIEAKKLFDVNSHSIDDLDSELNGKTKNEIIKLIEECFYKNHGESHFKKFWDVSGDNFQH